MENLLTSQFLISVLLVIFAWIGRNAATRLIKAKSSKQGADKRYLMNNTKNVINAILIISLFALWSAELQRFALSIAAFIVAIVLATKEIIQCVVGFIYISSTNPFRVGDWIQTKDYTGEVTATDWAKVTLLELDPHDHSYTGRSVFVPNSQLVTLPIVNLNYMRRYVNHAFSIVREDAGFNPFVLKQTLIDNANRYCADFSDVAERYNSLIETRLDIKISGPQPTVTISTTDIGKVRIAMSLFCPTKQAHKIEQKLVEDLMVMWLEHSQLTKANVDKTPTPVENETDKTEVES